MKKLIFILVLIVVCAADISPAAQTVHLDLQVDGNDIVGERTIMFEVESYSGGMIQDLLNGEPRVCFEPLTIVKQPDEHTPFLAEIACSTDVMVDATLTIEISDASRTANLQTILMMLKDWQIVSFQFGGFSSAVEPSQGSSGKPTVGVVTFKKLIDKATPPILRGRS